LEAPRESAVESERYHKASAFLAVTRGKSGKFCPANPAESDLIGEPRKLASRNRESARTTPMLQRKLALAQPLPI